MANLIGSKQRTYARKPPKNKLLTREDEFKIIEAYKAGKSCEYIRVFVLNRKFKTAKSISDALKKLGVYEKRDCSFYNKTKNHDYFKNIDSEYKAYFLGLMQSDGWIFSKTEGSKQIGLCIEEDYIVEKLKKELGTENKIVRRKKDKGNKTLYQLLVDSVFLYNDLARFGLKNKFTEQYMPVLPEKLYPHYLRGLFDGDGTVHIHEKTDNIHFGFLGGLKSMSQISFYLAYKLHIYQTQPTLANSNCFGNSIQTLYSLRYADNKDVKKIYNYLYKDATIFINRKREVLERWFANAQN